MSEQATLEKSEKLMQQVQQELAAESAGSDAAVILAEALASARTADSRQKVTGLQAALKQADRSRKFSPVMESPLPDGWPAPSLPGLIRVKTYPVARTAWVEDPARRNGQFMVLFRHIKDRQIAMTAPVVMRYGEDEVGDTEAMAFLYRHTGQGTPGEFGGVNVRDEQPLQVVSLATKGGYSSKRFSDALEKLQAWLEEHPQWRQSGPARVLAYNSPFLPSWLKYAEVQIPVEATD
ncbi:MAG: heme-binding protein [Planctomycetota bacterium]|jgi:hypothetical protein